MTQLARIEPNAKWIRGRLGDRTVVDSRNSRFVWEIPYYPAWYFPVTDVAAELRPTGDVEPTSNRGDATVYDLIVGDNVVPAAARVHVDSPIEDFRDLVRIEWGALDTWLEEETEVIIHPRSPFTRVDTLPSSRHVKVSIDGTVVAESDSPTILYETGLPPRYYLPADDVRLDLLTPTDSSTGCPYKGFAAYWTVTVDGLDHVDVVWSYADPLPESAGVAGLMCFYNEKVDIEVDGEPEERPTTPFS